MAEHIIKEKADDDEMTKAVNALADAIVTSCEGAEYSIFMNACIQAMCKVTQQANPTMSTVDTLTFILNAIQQIRAAESIIKPNIILKG